MSKLSRFVRRNNLAARKATWRLFNNHAPNATALYILGAQRSGTTLLLDCLEKSMEFDVLGESSGAMVNFRIKDDAEIRRMVESSRHKIVVFKPLTDSHRAREFLPLTQKSFVIWAFRRVEDRANSAVAKFGDHNLQILRDFARGTGFDRWQAQGLSEESLNLIRSFDYSQMEPETAAALFWYIRNRLFFESRLDELQTVLPLAYEDLVAAPARTMRGVCKFVGGNFKDAMVRDVHAKSVGREESRLSSKMQHLCFPLYEKLHTVQLQRWSALKLAE